MNRLTLIAAVIAAGPLAWAAPQNTIPATPLTPAQPMASSPDAQRAAAAESAKKSLAKARDFLFSQQKPDGGWHGEKEPPALTALALRSLLEAGVDPADPRIAKGYERLLAFQLPDGGIYVNTLANYNTAISISALAAAKNPAYQPKIDAAVKYLRTLQWVGTIKGGPADKSIDVNIDKANAWYGGFGYGGWSRGKGRPDLSNAHLAIAALKEAGVKPEDPAFVAALAFVSRLQNRSESNDRPWAGNDGGAIYGPSDDGSGESFGGTYVDAEGKRRLRSYGSMTYAMLKSFIYAGLTKDDPRVKAAWQWIGNNWTLDHHPGWAPDPNSKEPPKAALYYYYSVVGEALSTYGEPQILAPDGTPHDWRLQLIQKLASLQSENGSFTGEAKYMENNPVLTTTYAVTALSSALRDLEKPAMPGR